MTSLPTPEQWVIHEMNEMEMAEEIEKHINFVDEDGRSVHLQMQFVRHFLQRHDDGLPIIVAIATLPIILADGGILAFEDDIDTLRGIDFVISQRSHGAVAAARGLHTGRRQEGDEVLDR